MATKRASGCSDLEPHGVATWYGSAPVPGFPEKASAFSIEDHYSNALGAMIADVLIDRRRALSGRG